MSASWFLRGNCVDIEYASAGEKVSVDSEQVYMHVFSVAWDRVVGSAPQILRPA
jgi:hypothetical protein